MERPSWIPEGVDLDRPSVARVYDYYLGGWHNFEVDRTMARQAIEIMPELPQIMRANRAFLRRAVRLLGAVGIDQFVDVGSGIPTVGNVHEVAQQVNPHARVAYVDADPVAVAHSRMILEGDDRTVVVQADLRDPQGVLGDPLLQGLIDLDQPVGLLMVALLHFVPDEDRPVELLAQYRDAMASGSHLVISHGTSESLPDRGARMLALYSRSPTPLTSRTREQVTELFSGFELVPPGVVYVPEWRPEPSESVVADPERFATFAGVGRKP